MTYSKNDMKLLRRMSQLGPAAAIEEMLVDPDEFEDAGLREAALRIDHKYGRYTDQIYDDIIHFDKAIEKIDDAIELIEDTK